MHIFVKLLQIRHQLIQNYYRKLNKRTKRRIYWYAIRYSRKCGSRKNNRSNKVITTSYEGWRWSYTNRQRSKTKLRKRIIKAGQNFQTSPHLLNNFETQRYYQNEPVLKQAQQTSLGISNARFNGVFHVIVFLK